MKKSEKLKNIIELNPTTSKTSILEGFSGPIFPNTILNKVKDNAGTAGTSVGTTATRDYQSGSTVSSSDMYTDSYGEGAI